MSIPRSATFWWAAGLALLGVVSQLDPSNGPRPPLADRITSALLSGAFFFAMPYVIRGIVRACRRRRPSTIAVETVPAAAPASTSTSRPRRPRRAPMATQLLGDLLPLDVVGESFYMPQIRLLIDGELLDCLASRYPRTQEFESTDMLGGQLVREPQNSHDANAVAVYVRGHQVGHLSRQDAMQVAAVMDGSDIQTIEILHVRFMWKIRDYSGRRLRYDELKVGVKLG